PRKAAAIGRCDEIRLASRVGSDKVVHRKRAETRLTDVEGLVKPTWQEISERAYDEWHDAIVIDTASKTVDAALNELVSRLNSLAMR
ncbi:hypothetical protein ACC685_36320, partial [Rhizobium ruizarguesonis]